MIFEKTKYLELNDLVYMGMGSIPSVIGSATERVQLSPKQVVIISDVDIY